MLIQKESLGWNIRSFSYSKQIELDQIALDFIAPLFARDTDGIFCVLRDQLEPEIEGEDAEFWVACQRMLYSHTSQEFIRLFQERDPIGKVLYRSLRYVLSKHPSWVKTRSLGRVLVITESDSDLSLLEESELNQQSGYLISSQETLTNRMEGLLFDIIVNQKRSFPLTMLFEKLRVFVKEPMKLEYHYSVDSDPLLNTTINRHISDTLSYIDKNLLNKYESQEKLSRADRQKFLAAISEILKAFANGGVDESYTTYLNRHSEGEIPETEYKKMYKQQFEYVAKTAKKDFSARIKIDFKL